MAQPLSSRRAPFFFIVGVLRGVAATGVIEAGRLIISPVSLIADAWGRIALPRMGAHFRSNQPSRAYSIMFASMGLLSTMAVAYYLVVYFAWGVLESFLFRGRYPGVADIVIGWAVFSFVSQLVRCIGWTFMATERFRELALLGTVNAVAVVSFMLILVLPVPLYTTLVILTLGQLSIGIGLIFMKQPTPRLHEVAA